MFKQYIGWRFVLASIAVVIIGATIWFVSSLSRKIQEEERKKVATWVEANRELLQSDSETNLNLAVDIVTNNTTIPLILTDEAGNILDSRNFDTTLIREPQFLQKQLKAFKKQHPPFIMEVDARKNLYNYIYYGDSLILRQIRYYPYIQLIVVALFIGLALFAISSTNRATQNQVWVGLAKETAHQLGTPLSSMEAWLEILRENESNASITAELSKDVDRLKLITERFSKIGSVPQLEETDLIAQIENMVAYIRKRSPQKVQLTTHSDEDELTVMISPPLFDWVVENLLKNALDAMEGKGKIDINIQNHPTYVTIDVADTGKGIPKMNFEKVFKPGFSTKKRGWGLGLSLARRIIEDYHRGRLYVKSSELNKGTVFRILLRK
ncbi:Histidine kinase-, DNA gyrase B-, and HSP90-like ATPase [Chitinophaga terrae (ex Kim and Jung 2007)]|jgi:two-component sensor histidine kinase|uniref:histidine kinase n=1 Tax=Chitinophaga terrae (ex Kim and Jung 2007) TaxID=408074 RepID=A0A1H4BYG9_9BACT|nr:ATP-binding protein [Chitinophaga terrae (ex Kim and Jung 2007)]GEP91911.1 two-component sensor histidine kinase [Chitinophaga terrae (ex Kim and Jung 2007)]SEA53107.1 Histidine kinase-, DNA gyrase B-, and HSP90-like ATPase [Chitinophaga terrae (ex Kim and Jung 2007)]